MTTVERAPADTTDGRPATAQTLSRGLDVLRVIAAADGLTVAQVAAELGLGRTVVHRLVTTLLAHDMVHRGDDGALRVGLGVLELTGSVHPMLRDRTRSVLQRLADDVGATAHLVIVEGSDGVALSVVEPARSQYHVAYRAGSRFPLAQGGHGRALLAARRDRWEAVASRGELVPGLSGVSAAVPDVAGVELAVGVVSAGQLDARTVGPRVLAAAREVAQVL